jgi:hypothetical protein
VPEVGGPGTLGTFSRAFFAPGLCEPGDDLGGQAGGLLQGSCHLVGTEFCPPQVKGLGLQPFGNPPTVMLCVLVRVWFWCRLA